MKFFATFALVLALAACSTTPQSVVDYCICGPVSGTEADLVANVGDRVFFKFNKSTLTSNADEFLGRQASWLAKYASVKVLVAGNADERGTEIYNLALGQRRADAARAYLLALGVAPSRVQTISYGKDCPIVAGNDEAAYQQNRNAITSVKGFNPQSCH